MKGKSRGDGSGSRYSRSIFNEADDGLRPFKVRFRSSTLNRIEEIYEESPEAQSRAQVIRELVQFGLEQDFYRADVALNFLENLHHQTTDSDLQESISEVEEAIIDNTTR